MAYKLAEHWEELVDLTGVALIRMDRPAHQPDVGQLVAGVALDAASRRGVEGADSAALPGTVRASTSASSSSSSGYRQQGGPRVDDFSVAGGQESSERLVAAAQDRVLHVVAEAGDRHGRGGDLSGRAGRYRAGARIDGSGIRGIFILLSK